MFVKYLIADNGNIDIDSLGGFGSSGKWLKVHNISINNIFTTNNKER